MARRGRLKISQTTRTNNKISRMPIELIKVSRLVIIKNVSTWHHTRNGVVIVVNLRGTKKKRGTIDRKITSSKISVGVSTMTRIEEQNSNMDRVTTIINGIKMCSMMTEEAIPITSIRSRSSDSPRTKIGGILKATMTLTISLSHAGVVRSAPFNKPMISTRRPMVIDGAQTGIRIEISTASSRGKKKSSNNASSATPESITRRETNSSIMLASVASSLKSSVPVRKRNLMLMKKIVSLTLAVKSTQAVEAFLAAAVETNKASIKKASVIKKITPDNLMLTPRNSQERTMTTRSSKSRMVSSSSRRSSLTRRTTTSSKKSWTPVKRKTAKLSASLSRLLSKPNSKHQHALFRYSTMTTKSPKLLPSYRSNSWQKRSRLGSHPRRRSGSRLSWTSSASASQIMTGSRPRSNELSRAAMSVLLQSSSMRQDYLAASTLIETTLKKPNSACTLWQGLSLSEPIFNV